MHRLSPLSALLPPSCLGASKRVDGAAATATARPGTLAALTVLTAAVAIAAFAGWSTPAGAQTQAPAPTQAPLQSIERLDVARYMGTWYQVAWFPNRFQRQCASDTQAQYQLREDGRVEVLNQCRRGDGKTASASGLARPVGQVANGSLEPAQLQVSFLPAVLRWTGIGWGNYWVVDLPADYRYAVISEPTREYLWILSRTPALSPDDRDRIRARVQELGLDLARWVDHPQTLPAVSR
mgnify:CR=1 FL=1